MLSCKNLSVSLSGKEILHSLSAEFEPGKIYVLLGKNGSGKTTWLRALSGSISTYYGIIQYDHEEIHKINRKVLAKRIAVLPQILPQADLTVGELLAMGRTPHLPFSGKLQEKDLQHVSDALKRFNLTNKENVLLTELSGGERARAFFAMTVVKDAQLLFFDEPCASLDPQYRKDIYQYIQEMKEEGKTILLTMHDLNEALSLADQILLLDQGQLIFNGSPDQLITSALPETIFGMEKTSGIFYR